jgi:hypothetical protein
VGVREQALIQDFVLWFMDCDLHGIMSLWGIKYNQMMSESSTPKVSKYHNNLFVELPDEFTMQDLNVVIMKYGNTTNAVEAIHLWKKTGLIEKIGKGRYRKLKKK